MNGSESTVVYWGWALAAGAYSLMSLRLIGQQYLGGCGQSHCRGARGLGADQIWSVSSLLALTESSAWWLGAQAADILRYLCWTVFVALFFRTNAGQANDGWYRWWPGLVVVGLFGAPAAVVMIYLLAGAKGQAFLMVLLAIAGLGSAGTVAAQCAGGFAVERQTVCLGLAGTFLFDLCSRKVLFRA
jgi:hypothetical protein